MHTHPHTRKVTSDLELDHAHLQRRAPIHAQILCQLYVSALFINQALQQFLQWLRFVIIIAIAREGVGTCKAMPNAHECILALFRASICAAVLRYT
jgi:flagellar biosynthesis protein FliP